MRTSRVWPGDWADDDSAGGVQLSSVCLPFRLESAATIFYYELSCYRHRTLSPCHDGSPRYCVDLPHSSSKYVVCERVGL